MASISTRELVDEDRSWVREILTEHWASTRIVSPSGLHQVDQLPGIVALIGDQRAGLAALRMSGAECEIVSLNSQREGLGVGSALLDATVGAARRAQCRRLWLATSNDNLNALGFYQRRGWRLVAIHRNAFEAYRTLKPEIPQMGYEGIPLRDAIEMEFPL